MRNKCPKCEQKLSPFYIKQNCPSCGANLLYYKFSEQLEADSKNAEKEAEDAKNLVALIKRSVFSSPLLILRFILLFSPIAALCLPIFRAAHKNLSLISFIMSIKVHGFDISTIISEKAYLFALLAMISVIAISLLAVIISLFFATKYGTAGNIIVLFGNTLFLGIFAILSCAFGGKAKIGLYVVFGLFVLLLLLNYLLVKPKTKKRLIASCITLGTTVALVITALVFPSQNVTPPVEANKGEIRAVSFNLACTEGNRYDDTNSAARAKRFVKYMEEVQPDLIGTQEINAYWMNVLKEQLPKNFMSYGVKRGGDADENSSEMNSIFWNTDKFTALETNTFWLSKTPDTESYFVYFNTEGEIEVTQYKRICSYAVLKDKEGNLILFMNTQLDDSNNYTISCGADIVNFKLSELREKYGKKLRVVLTGDINQTIGESAYFIFAHNLNDTTDKSNLKATYQNWGYKAADNKPTDFVFTSGKGVNYKVLDNTDDGYISDHYGVMADINFS